MKRKNRIQIPQIIRDEVLVEFNHTCVRCDAPYHEVHHIDGDPSNNSKDNLIVLCPNCHQGKVHGKSIKITPEQLRLYKKMKSKAVFKPIYNAVRSRLEFIEADKYEDMALDEISSRSKDLIEFISTLSHGEYYVRKLKEYLRTPLFAIVWTFDTPDYVFKQRRKEQEKELKTQIEENRDNILRLVLECLELQPE